MGRDRVHVGLRLLDRHSRLQPSHYQKPMKIVIHLLRLEHQRHRELCWQTILKPRLKHAHNGIGLPIELHRLANNLHVAAQLQPQLVRKDDDVILSLLTFFRKKTTAKKVRDALHSVEAHSYAVSGNELWLLLRCNIEGSA